MEDLITASEAVFVARYNPLHGHLALDGVTPAQATGFDLRLDVGWADPVKIDTRNRTGKET